MGLFAWFCVPWLSLLILVPAAAIVYLALVWMLRAFSSDDVALFRQALSLSKKVSIAQQEVALTDASK